MKLRCPERWLTAPIWKIDQLYKQRLLVAQSKEIENANPRNATDYAKWRPVFDKHKPLRDKAGLTKVRVYRDADNPTELVVWSETSDVAKAREALNGQEI